MQQQHTSTRGLKKIHRRPIDQGYKESLGNYLVYYHRVGEASWFVILKKRVGFIYAGRWFAIKGLSGQTFKTLGAARLAATDKIHDPATLVEE